MSEGLVYSLISHMLFILSGYAIHIYMARLLGPKEYGVFGICLAVVTISYTFLKSGIREVVSKSVAKHPKSARNLLKRGLLLQIIISSFLALVVAVFSKRIAYALSDKDLEKPQGLELAFPENYIFSLNSKVLTPECQILEF